MLKQLKEDIQAVFARDPAARNTFEVLTTYPGIHALMMHRVAHELWVKDCKTSARILSSLSCFSISFDPQFLTFSMYHYSRLVLG